MMKVIVTAVIVLVISNISAQEADQLFGQRHRGLQAVDFLGDGAIAGAGSRQSLGSLQDSSSMMTGKGSSKSAGE